MRILTISDLHAPFTNPRAVRFLRRLSREIKPDVVVCLGDEIDSYNASRFDKDSDAPRADSEFADALATLRRVFALFPVVRVCESNHVMRPYKRASEYGIPGRMLKPIREALDAPADWVWAAQWRVDGIAFQHGDGFSGPQAALQVAVQNGCPSVIGHVHSFAGVQFTKSLGGVLWGMNAGCLIDPDSIAMRYAKHGRNKPIIGTGVIVNGVPSFRPLE